METTSPRDKLFEQFVVVSLKGVPWAEGKGRDSTGTVNIDHLHSNGGSRSPREKDLSPASPKQEKENIVPYIQYRFPPCSEPEKSNSDLMAKNIAQFCFPDINRFRSHSSNVLLPPLFFSVSAFPSYILRFSFYLIIV